jgi:hypothetical protein
MYRSRNELVKLSIVSYQPRLSWRGLGHEEGRTDPFGGLGDGDDDAGVDGGPQRLFSAVTKMNWRLARS